jgi:hypothetical protein
VRRIDRMDLEDQVRCAGQQRICAQAGDHVIRRANVDIRASQQHLERQVGLLPGPLGQEFGVASHARLGVGQRLGPGRGDVDRAQEADAGWVLAASVAGQVGIESGSNWGQGLPASESSRVSWRDLLPCGAYRCPSNSRSSS